MPTVLRSGPYRLYFYSHEPNEPPHIYVDREDLQRSSGSIRCTWRETLDFALTNCARYNWQRLRHPLARPGWRSEHRRPPEGGTGTQSFPAGKI